MDTTVTACFELLRAINSPRSLAVWLILSQGDHADLLEFGLPDPDALDSVAFRDDYQATALLTKSNFLALRNDPEETARARFLDAEQQCLVTNKTVLTHEWENHRYTRLLRKEVLCILGRSLVDRSAGSWLSFAFEKGQWGPGVTSSCRGTALSSYNKLQSTLEASPKLARFGADRWVDSVPYFHERGHKLHVVDYNRVTFVPKNSKTHRAIAIEPHLNVFGQLGMGKLLKTALRRAGCNLRSQTRNQELARLGSLNGSYATVDLAMASDTISYQLVQSILPWGLFEALDALRSPKYVIRQGDTAIPYQKFSSMGNGATFELESLIFLACARVALRIAGLDVKECSVYGDDIAISTSAVSELYNLISHCGFKVNQDKTFDSGSFRESCGSDFHRGVQVRPFFIRERIDTAKPQTVYKAANGVSRWAHHMGFRDGRFFPCWKVLFLSLPKSLRFRVSRDHGDAGFWSEFDESAAVVSCRFIRHEQHLVYRTQGLIFKAFEEQKTCPESLWASVLLDMSGETCQWDAGPKQPLDLTKFSHRQRGRWYKARLTSVTWDGPGSWVFHN